MVKAMDCGIIVSEFELQSYYLVHFLINTPSSQLWLKLYHYCCSTKMSLALYIPRRLICHKTKKPENHRNVTTQLHTITRITALQFFSLFFSFFFFFFFFFFFRRFKPFQSWRCSYDKKWNISQDAKNINTNFRFSSLTSSWRFSSLTSSFIYIYIYI